MKRDELIEVIKHVFCGLDGGPPFDKRAKDKAERRLLGLEYDSQDEAVDSAEYILTAIEAAGFRVVPYEPTEVMMQRGARRVMDFNSESGTHPRTKAMYRAMLDAAKDE